MSHNDLMLLARIGTGFALAFIFGFERQLRGSPAGDRTFAVVGTAATAVTAVAAHSSPQAIAGVVTDIVVGYGHLLLGVITAAGLLLTLELPHIPVLRNSTPIPTATASATTPPSIGAVRTRGTARRTRSLR